MEFEKRDFAEWQAVFAALDACVEPLLPLSEALEHPQLQARGLVARCRWRRRQPGADGLSDQVFRRPVGLATSARRSAPTTVAVLEGLGYSAERIAELKAAGAIA